MKSIKERWKAESKQMVPKEEPQEEKTEKAFTIYKTDEDQRLVFGWASVAITIDGEVLEDRQHDMIEPEDLEEAAYEYVLNFRDTGEEHLPGYRKKGRLVESCVFTPEKQRAMGIPENTLPVAWWIGFKIDDEDTWQRVKNGTYRMFSIEGKAQREPIEKADRTARTFEEVLKFNPYHDAMGRFTSANGAGARASLRGKTENGQRLLDQYKEKHGGKASGGAGSPTAGNSKEHKMAEGKDLMKTMDPSKLGEMTTEQVLAAQGFDGRPKVASSLDEFSQAVGDNGNIACRGISADEESTLDAYVDQLKYGDFYVKCQGGNAMGRGMYMATSWGGTNNYDTALWTAETYAHDKSYGKVINMTLDKSAKVIDISELEKMAAKDSASLGSSFEGPASWSPFNNVRDDIGAYAAAKGYDAIRQSGNYTVVLNRTKLVILDETGSLFDIPGGDKVLDDNWAPF